MSDKTSTTGVTDQFFSGASHTRHDAFCDAMERLAAAMVVADGDVDPQEMQAANAALDKIMCADHVKAHFDGEVARLKNRDFDVVGFAASVEPHLDIWKKRILMTTLFKVLAADGEVAEEEAKLFEAVGSALALPAADLQEIIDKGEEAAAQ